MSPPLSGVTLIVDTHMLEQIVSSLDSSPDILAQLQEIIAPIIIYTLENMALGQ
jgi:hypothetical protein